MKQNNNNNNDAHVLRGHGLYNDGDVMEHGGQTIVVVKHAGITELLNHDRLRASLIWAAADKLSSIDIDLVLQEVYKNIFDGISPQEISEALILAVISFLEYDPSYSYVAGRLLLKKIFKEAINHSMMRVDSDFLYQQSFIDSIVYGAQHGFYDRRLLDFDLEFLASKLVFNRDNLFDYMGLRTLYERYFTRRQGVVFELPQAFWMRVSMGLCYGEANKNERAVEFYNVLSQFDYIPGTPTLLHSGLIRPQLSSCYLNTVKDDLNHIFKCYGDNAQLSKWSGGIGTDWTAVRACGAMVNSIRTESQGVIPFLKIASDVTAAINRSGKRRSAACVYLETWHYEIEDFIDLRKNTGDERRRTHDISTANWIPDLFMQRVLEDKDWTLFSPNDVPDLHDLYGHKFKERYEEYESRAHKGHIKLFKTIPAKVLWRKMLSRLFETGHPWITFKDAGNVRSPQDHVGVIHSSNLCTEIFLNTSETETAVCNLGSINLANHIKNRAMDLEKVSRTVQSAIRMLDNVIDTCFYPTAEAKESNIKHRPIGLGMMGFQDALYQIDINFDSQEALQFADESMEVIAYYAYYASSLLAKERGTYSSYKGSKWDRGILPQDTLDLLEQERGNLIDVKRGGKLDWTPVRNHIREFGMRNSNVLAIAPTATISNVVGCFPCIEPIYKNLYVKSNMSGEFTIVNKYLIQDLKGYGLWNRSMLDQLKYYDGSIQMIDGIPEHLKHKYKEAFELDPLHLINISAIRGKWIDQSASHNVFVRGTSGKLLGDIYMTAWQKGMKSTYYLRSLGASQVEKSTLDAKTFGFTQKRTYDSKINIEETGTSASVDETTDMIGASCSLSDDPECEVCQ